MKKCNFYSFMSARYCGGEADVRPHAGYFDGVFYYYRTDFGDWWAICPETGLGVAQTPTRKAAVACAHQVRGKRDDVLQTERGRELARMYAEAVRRAQVREALGLPVAEGGADHA